MTELRTFKFNLHYFNGKYVDKIIEAKDLDEAYAKVEEKFGHLIFEYVGVEETKDKIE